mgnify:FL=1
MYSKTKSASNNTLNIAWWHLRSSCFVKQLNALVWNSSKTDLRCGTSTELF